jgi:2-methylcitrate dehydratase
VVEEPEFTRMMPARRPSRVTVTLKNGNALTETVFVSKGDTETPYSNEELESKFLNLTEPLYGEEKAKEILDKSWRIEDFNDIRDYTNGL